MSFADRSDQDNLLTLARQGDGDALGRLFDGYRRYLKLLARLQIGEEQQAKIDASDVVQQTFLEALHDFATFRGTSEKELMNWLRRILAANLADHVHRYHGRQRRDIQLERSLNEQLDRSSVALDRNLIANQTTPSQSVVRREQAVILADALDQLPEDYREVLVLRHLKGHKFSQVARRMGRTEGSVYQLWARALAQLRRAIGDDR